MFTSAPSTYGLLGGVPTAGSTGFALDGPTVPFVDSLANDRWEKPMFGLPDEYRDLVLREVPSGLLITIAAHGQVGSSQRVFASLAKMLVELFPLAETASDQVLVDMAHRVGLRGVEGAHVTLSVPD